jgi:hypothetical protein
MSNTQDQTSWETLDPWEKAAQWINAAPELSHDIVAMAKIHADRRMDDQQKEAEHRRTLEREQATHQHRMDARLWWTHMVALGINAAGLLLLAILAAQFGEKAIAPALTVLAAGGGLSIASYLVSNNIRRSWQAQPQTADSQSAPTA